MIEEEEDVELLFISGGTYENEDDAVDFFRLHPVGLYHFFKHKIAFYTCHFNVNIKIKLIKFECGAPQVLELLLPFRYYTKGID